MYTNKNLVLISGKSATGKSLSLRNINKPEGVIYLNCENGKELPFRDTFKAKVEVSDPMTVMQAIQEAEALDDVHTIVIDSLTYLMEMYESVYVVPSQDGRQAWQNYAQYFLTLMRDYIGTSTKNIIVIAHTMDVMNETDRVMETLVKVKGSLMNQGIESRFTNVISTKKISLNKLQEYKTPLLTYSERDKRLGFKYVFQTQPTESTRHERMRSPWDMWDIDETYIDNDVQLVLDRLHTYFNS